jgi:hypothetical protein
MATLYHYAPLSPLREEYRDDGSEVILTIPCQIKGSCISEICLLGTDQIVYAIRITLSNVDDRNLHQEEQQK